MRLIGLRTERGLVAAERIKQSGFGGIRDEIPFDRRYTRLWSLLCIFRLVSICGRLASGYLEMSTFKSRVRTYQGSIASRSGRLVRGGAYGSGLAGEDSAIQYWHGIGYKRWGCCMHVSLDVKTASMGYLVPKRLWRYGRTITDVEKQGEIDIGTLRIHRHETIM